MRATHTFATLELSKAAFDEIAKKLRQAGYDHAFSLDGKTIDMHGIGVEEEAKPIPAWSEDLRVGFYYRRRRIGGAVYLKTTLSTKWMEVEPPSWLRPKSLDGIDENTVTEEQYRHLITASLDESLVFGYRLENPPTDK